ncbi:hypothetical protein CSPAE12_11869 [Colletotrichum incanum]|nr:hypothetical protein CSPAE12_11869 [Colletotrichum incanum]
MHHRCGVHKRPAPPPKHVRVRSRKSSGLLRQALRNLWSVAKPSPTRTGRTYPNPRRRRTERDDNFQLLSSRFFVDQAVEQCVPVQTIEPPQASQERARRDRARGRQGTSRDMSRNQVRYRT